MIPGACMRAGFPDLRHALVCRNPVFAGIGSLSPKAPVPAVFVFTLANGGAVFSPGAVPVAGVSSDGECVCAGQRFELKDKTRI